MFMTQTNDDLLYRIPRIKEKIRYSKKNYKYTKDNNIFLCVQIGEIVDNPTLISQLALPSVSIVILSYDNLKIYYPPQYAAKIVDRKTYLCRQHDHPTKAKYSTNHGSTRLVYYTEVHDLFLVPEKEFLLQFTELTN
jgi:hypothetical protein